MFLDGSLVHLTVLGVPCTATCSLPIPANWMRFMPCGAKTKNGLSQNLGQANPVTTVLRSRWSRLRGPNGSLVHLTVHGVLCTATCSQALSIPVTCFTPRGAKTQKGLSKNLIQAIITVYSKGTLEILQASKGLKVFTV